MLFLYDDSVPAPAVIREVIGVERFGEVLKRKQRLGDLVEQIVKRAQHFEFVRITDNQSRDALIDLLGKRRGDEHVVRLPSCLIPVDLEMFSRTLRKLPYSPGSAILGGQFDDEAATLFSRADVITLLGIADPKQRRGFIRSFAQSSLNVGNAMGLVDLREVRSFLSFMIGATELRFFNASDVSGDVFRKSSNDVRKMRAEYNFFHIVPEAMKRFLLPTFDYAEEAGKASYSMENLPVPDAALQIVHHSFDPANFGRLLDRFFQFIASRNTLAVGVERVRDEARGSILGKMHRRLDELLMTEAGRKLDRLLASSGPKGDIAAMRERATSLIEQAIAADQSGALAVGHGDPCFSNILFSRKLGLFRLIDPRGATTLEEAYMHPLYDLAKFSHSVLSGYDFINNGLFECRVGDQLELILELDGNGPPAWMREAFAGRLAEAGYDLRIVRAYELSLFLSMLPLHVDAPRKLPGFCLAAASIIDELEGQKH